jgi:predicted aspartyl protease
MVANCWKKQNEQRNYSNNKRSAATTKEDNEISQELTATLKDLREAARINLSTAATKFEGSKHHNMVTIGRIGKKDATILIDTGTEGTNLISTNFMYTNGINSTPYDTPIAIRMATKGSRSTSAAYVTLPVQLGDAPSFNARFDVAPLGGGRDAILGMPFLHDVKAIIDPYSGTVRLQELGGVVIQCAPPASQLVKQSAAIQKIEDFVQRFPKLFSEESVTQATLPPLRAPGLNHRILIDHQKSAQFKTHHMKLPEALKNEFLKWKDNWIKAGIAYIGPGLYAVPTFGVAKKSGEIRWVHDLRPRNNITIRDYSQMPDQVTIRLNAAMASEKGCVSLVDLSNAYHQIRVEPDDEQYNSINTPFGCMNVKVMLQGDCNAPATMTRVMNILLGKYIGKWCYAYLDDIVIISNTIEEHIEHLNTVFKILQDNDFYLKKEKCNLFQKKLKLLGHMIEDGQIKPTTEFINKIYDLPTPTNKKQLQQFLGLVNYIAPHVFDIQIKSKPLSEITGSTTEWRWGPTEQNSWKNVRESIKEFCPIRPLNYESAQKGKSRIYLICDASIAGYGAILCQGTSLENAPKYIAGVTSKAWSPAYHNYSTTLKELRAMIGASRTFYQQLIGCKFTLVTDHLPLKKMLETPSPRGQQIMWIEDIAPLDFDVEYIQGLKNKGADALSRLWENTPHTEIQEEFLEPQDQQDKDIKAYYIIPSSATTIEPLPEETKESNHTMTEFHNKYSILSDRNTNFPPLPEIFSEGFHQMPVSDDKFEVDLDPGYPDYNMEMTIEDLAKYSDNTLYCHPTRHWYSCLNKDGCPYHYDCSATSTGIPYKALKDFKDLDEYNINEWIEAEDCCDWKTLVKSNPQAEFSPTPEGIDMCLDCEDWRVEPRTTASDTNPMAIDFEYVDIQETTLWKPMSELENDMPNSNAITRSQAKKHKTNEAKETMEEGDEPMEESTEEDTPGTFAPAAINLDIQDEDYQMKIGAIIEAPILEHIRLYRHRDPIYQAKEEDKTSFPHYTWRLNVLWKHIDTTEGRRIQTLYIPNIPYHPDGLHIPDEHTENLRTAMIRQYHNNLLNHSGHKKVSKAMSMKFNWPGMTTDIKTFCEQCPSCQLNKQRTSKPAGKTFALQVPQHPWQSIAIDFLGPLKNKKANEFIMAIICRFSGMTCLIPLTKLTSVIIAKALKKNFIPFYGIPDEILSDRDPRFTAKFWKEMSRLMGIELIMTTSYHQNTNGQLERTNKIIGEQLRILSKNGKEPWEDFLPSVQHAINTSYVHWIDRTPFELAYGRTPKTLPTFEASEDMIDSSTVPAAEKFVHDMMSEHKKAAEALMVARHNSAIMVQKRRNPNITFNVGDMVTMPRRTKDKLVPKKFNTTREGPFMILEIDQHQNHKLQLPQQWKILPWFSASELRHWKGEVPTDLLEQQNQQPSKIPEEPDLSIKPIPSRIEDHRFDSDGNVEILVRWRGKPSEDNSWEQLRSIDNANIWASYQRSNKWIKRNEPFKCPRAPPTNFESLFITMDEDRIFIDSEDSDSEESDY